METIIATLVSGLIGWFTTYMYFRKSKKDTDIQAKDIKNEFNNLNDKVDSILKSEFISEQDRTQQLTEISSELKKWVNKLNSDPGEIESKIDMKVNELQNNSFTKSNLLRPYINKIINEMDSIINELNKSGKNISWEKPILPSNLYEVDLETNIEFEGNIVANIEIYSKHQYILFSIKNNELVGIRKKGTLTYFLHVENNQKIKLGIKSEDELSFINTYYDFEIEKADEIYSRSLQDLFGYILTKFCK